ncbi:rRNA-processing protein and EBNA1-binding protein ebp2 [Myotisia sp. PD_48]|nr:rRNA-processing protein and EBNA1-binding protein ebp2 [Myotisia sp. PD_48]
MAKKSKLLSALDAHKGRDFDLERQKKLRKAAEKKKRSKGADKDAGEDTVNGDEQAANDSESDGGVETSNSSKIAPKENKTEQNSKGDDLETEKENEIEAIENSDEEENQDEESEMEEDEDIPLSELSGDEAVDVIPHQRLTINNSAAIRASLKRITLVHDHTTFSEHQSLTSTLPMDIPDPNDDLTRELAFYKVCAAATKTARALLKKEGIPFSRPTDYFAEMVKDDEHMTKIKKKLYDEAASKKASAEARKQRELKKFGKQVQVAKLQERHKEKRETLEKINSLKRKRKDAPSGTTQEDEMFDVALEEAGKSDSRRGSRGKPGEGSSSKRQKKDKKFGFGGKKRFAKSGDAVSSGDMSKFSVGKMKGRSKSGGGSKRLGKSRRSSKGI